MRRPKSSGWRWLYNPVTLALAFAALCALPSLAQDEPCPPVEELALADEGESDSQIPTDAATVDIPPSDVDEPAAEPEQSTHPRLFASAWCPVHRGSPADDSPGCDGGLAVSLYAWRRLAVVAVVGGDTIGPGLAWVAYRGDEGPVVAVAVGVVARYDGRGVDASTVYPAVGVTANLWRRE